MSSSTRMVASRVEERIKDMSAQGKEKMDHVWIEVWIRKVKVWEKMHRDYKRTENEKLNNRQESGGSVKGREAGEGGTNTLINSHVSIVDGEEEGSIHIESKGAWMGGGIVLQHR